MRTWRPEALRAELGHIDILCDDVSGSAMCRAISGARAWRTTRACEARNNDEHFANGNGHGSRTRRRFTFELEVALPLDTWTRRTCTPFFLRTNLLLYILHSHIRTSSPCSHRTHKQPRDSSILFSVPSTPCVISLAATVSSGAFDGLLEYLMDGEELLERKIALPPACALRWQKLEVGDQFACAHQRIARVRLHKGTQ